MKRLLFTLIITFAGVTNAATPKEITVLSWNTEHYRFERRPAAEQRELEQNMFALIRTANPDIVLIQETYGSFERFKEGLAGYNAVLQSECNSIFTKFKIGETKRLWVDKLAKEPIIFNTPVLALSEVEAGDLRLRISSFAMFWQPACIFTPPNLTAEELVTQESVPQKYPLTPRAKAIQEVVAAMVPYLSEKDKVPMLIGGDFNSMSHLDWTAANVGAEGHCGRVVPWAVSKAMIDAGFVDAYRTVHPDEVKDYGVTCPIAGSIEKPSHPIVRIDYLYSAGNKLKPIAAETIQGMYHRPFTWRGKKFSMFPSDHAPILIRYAVSSPMIDKEVDKGWSRVMRDYYWEPTSLIYTCLPKDVQKANFYTNGFRIWEKGGDYGHGLEDCAILGGVALSGICDKYLATGDKALATDARKLAKGLINLATVHGVKGFVARGICVEDGKSVCALSSVDQHTHCLHGLWRYWHSELMDASLKPDIERVVSEVADRMTTQVTAENDWSFQQAVGKGTTRGICKMRYNHPHEGARLAMFYAVAWDITRRTEYRELWRKYVDEGLANSMRLATASQAQRKKEFERWMPNYALLQMQTSLEVLYALSPSEGERRWVRAAMQKPAEMAAERAKRNLSDSGRWLCSCAELSLAQTMVGDFEYGAEQQQILLDAISAESFADKATITRIVHLFAAWWRWRARGK